LTSVDLSAQNRIDSLQCTKEDGVSRLQLALNVSDLGAAVAFYSRLFATPPTKIRPGYANFAISDPPLKLVLIENMDTRGSGTDGALNHLGVEVATQAEVVQASTRLAATGLTTTEQSETTCCYAVQDKVWVEDPDGAAWEVYTVLADAPVESGLAGDGWCCANDTDARSPAPACC
jgi:catechol 2,3-dioxygenase-like lactoylglutathione lyase family enzyme